MENFESSGKDRVLYVIDCVYRSPDSMTRGSFNNIGFRSRKEAQDFCEFHSDENMFYTWRKLYIGKFVKPKRKKR